jgi:hypothetical protein
MRKRWPNIIESDAVLKAMAGILKRWMMTPPPFSSSPEFTFISVAFAIHPQTVQNCQKQRIKYPKNTQNCNIALCYYLPSDYLILAFVIYCTLSLPEQ